MKIVGVTGLHAFSLNFVYSIKIVGITGLGGLWALEWEWQNFFLVISVKIFYLAISVKIFYLA